MQKKIIICGLADIQECVDKFRPDKMLTIINKNFAELDVKKVSSKVNKISLLKEFKHNYILLVNGNLYSSNFDHEDKSKIKINSYKNDIDYEISKNPLVCLNHALAEDGYSLEVKNFCSHQIRKL